MSKNIRQVIEKHCPYYEINAKSHVMPEAQINIGVQD